MYKLKIISREYRVIIETFLKYFWYEDISFKEFNVMKSN